MSLRDKIIISIIIIIRIWINESTKCSLSVLLISFLPRGTLICMYSEVLLHENISLFSTIKKIEESLISCSVAWAH